MIAVYNTKNITLPPKSYLDSSSSRLLPTVTRFTALRAHQQKKEKIEKMTNYKYFLDFNITFYKVCELRGGGAVRFSFH